MHTHVEGSLFLFLYKKKKADWFKQIFTQFLCLCTSISCYCYKKKLIIVVYSKQNCLVAALNMFHVTESEEKNTRENTKKLLMVHQIPSN